jgi:hypothetical protein
LCTRNQRATIRYVARSSHAPQEDTASAFEDRVIPCAGRDAAEAEAKRQQALEAGDAVWIYVRIDDVWSAKRTPAELAIPKDSIAAKLFQAVLNSQP